MRMAFGVTGTVQFQGPISLERALFCVGCEVIFTGAALCPRCSGETVWPLAEWVRPARQAPAEPLLRLVKTPTEYAARGSD